jgi:hypothetical protein
MQFKIRYYTIVLTEKESMPGMTFKNRLIEATLFFIIGSILYCGFILIFTRLFDQRMPVIQEFLPLFAVFVLSIFIFFNKDT